MDIFRSRKIKGDKRKCMILFMHIKVAKREMIIESLELLKDSRKLQDLTVLTRSSHILSLEHQRSYSRSSAKTSNDANWIQRSNLETFTMKTLAQVKKQSKMDFTKCNLYSNENSIASATKSSFENTTISSCKIFNKPSESQIYEEGLSEETLNMSNVAVGKFRIYKPLSI